MFGSTVAALAATMACVGGIVVAWQLLGEPVIREFIVGWELPIAAVPTRLPLGEDAFWEMLRQQADLLRRMTHLWGEVDWLDWRTVLFVYLTVCFSLRLAPPKRDLRPALLAVLVIAGLIAAVEALRGNEMSGLWQLLTYLWTLLLWLLAVSLAITGVAVLIRVLAGKGPGGSTGRRSRRRTAAADEDE
jgi:hypothetical protein